MSSSAQTPGEKSRRGIQSIEIGGRLLTALVDEGGPMSLGDLARKAGMPSAKAHPYLVSFSSFGLIEQDPLTGRYELGPFALQLGLISLHLLDPVRIAIPMITQLATDIDQTIGLSVLGNQGPTIIYIAESSYPIHVNMRTGTVMSIQSTATGRVFAAFLPPRQVERMVEQERYCRSIRRPRPEGGRTRRTACRHSQARHGESSGRAYPRHQCDLCTGFRAHGGNTSGYYGDRSCGQFRRQLERRDCSPGVRLRAGCVAPSGIRRPLNHI